MQSNELNKKNVNKLVISFYTRVLKDEKLAPFFIAHLGDDFTSDRWSTHMELLTDFWTTLALGTNDYNGQPYPAHAKIEGLDKESFQSWINLFFISVDKVFVEDIGLKFKEKSSIIASNFMRNLGI